MSTQEIKTEQGIFLIQEEKKLLKVSFIEDHTDEIGVITEEISNTLSKEVSAMFLIEATRDLYLTALRLKKQDRKKGTIVKTVFTDYSFENIQEKKDAFLVEIKEKGRVPFLLVNKSVITVCRPNLGFENKDEAFQARRFNVEKKYWEAKLDDERTAPDFKALAVLVLTLFDC